MSYILEALRRAQAERERGQVPGLEAQAMGHSPATAAPRRTQRWVLPAMAGLALLALLALLAWAALWRTSAPAVALVAATPPVPPPVPQFVPQFVPPAPISSVPASAAPMVVVSAPPQTRPAVPAPSNPEPAPPRSLAWAQLSAEQRNQLPPMILGGAIWSDNAASRFVIVNGQVLREGDSAAPGVLLERIGPKAVWLRWRELRIEVPI